ncbi:MAG TPA: hypothetical protein VK822_22180 [Acetobacteraceae bacterium]|nr:hypothetical protein [Acetobacteraceae bacterium]
MTGFWHQLASGQLTAVTIMIWTCCGSVVATLGGALAGIMLAGRDLGNELAGAMGAMFGPTGAVPGVLLGLIILALL